VVTIYFLSFFILIYIYLGYPIVGYLLSHIYKKDIATASYEPTVTILIAAFNEERHIKVTIENKLELDYPKDKLQVIVVSDGSTDRTDEIVRSFAERGVMLIRQEPRKGKTSALNLAVQRAHGDIIVFSDANSLYNKDSLKYLMENFADPSVGYVTGKMVYVNPDGTTVGNGCSAYMKYENLLRSYEARIGSVVGVDGGIDAVQKKLYREMNPDQLPDFVLPLKVVEQGYRVVFEPRALLEEEALKSPEDENRMRVRVSLRALWALLDMRSLLNPFRYGIFSFQLFSHKVLRYLGIVFIVLLYLSNFIIIIWHRSWFYKVAFIIQNIAIALALVSHFLEKTGKSSGILYILNYFYLINISAGQALFKFILGKKQVTWTPRKG